MGKGDKARVNLLSPFYIPQDADGTRFWVILAGGFVVKELRLPH
jgi:hypothetical protein